MLEWFLIATNGILGVPLALAALIVLREILRSGVALAFGFRVFELRWGVGPVLFERPIGPIDLAVARWPLAGHTLARSGVPRRHRMARGIIAIAPLTAQFLWLAFRSSDASGFGVALQTGPALFAVFDLANVILLAFHCLVPIEFGCGTRSDVRLLLDAALAQTDSSRTARASYYARLCRHRLERADVTGAAAALEQGLTQLGREAILVESQERFKQSDLASVIDQGDCADDLQRLIEAAEPSRALERASWTLPERLRQGAISALPAAFLVLLVAITQVESLAFGIESVLLRRSEAVVAEGDAEECTGQIDRYSRWIRRADSWLPLSASDRSDRFAALAELARCRGDLVASAAYQGEAMLAANAARAEPAAATLAEPERWLENELRLAELLRQAAAVEHQRESYRQALGTLGKAERRLASLRSRISGWPDAAIRSQADATIEAERSEVLELREQVLAGLGRR